MTAHACCVGAEIRRKEVEVGELAEVGVGWSKGNIRKRVGRWVGFGVGQKVVVWVELGVRSEALVRSEGVGVLE